MDTTSPPSNSFLNTLQRHRSGGLLADASEKLAAVVAGVHATGKTGSMTVQFVVKPAQRGQSCIVLSDSIKAKVPALEAEASIWYAGESGQLTKTDPRQAEMAFKPTTVEGGAKPETTTASAVAAAK